jgi:hypothetical protein
MKYKIELELPESKLALALEFLRSLSFVKAVNPIAPGEMPADPTPGGVRPFGLLKGAIQVPDDFNDPIEDMKDYI